MERALEIGNKPVFYLARGSSLEALVITEPIKLFSIPNCNFKRLENCTVKLSARSS